MLYKYGMRLRPFSIGCQPKGQTKYIDSIKKDSGYYGFIYYDKSLSNEDVRKFELTFIEKVPLTQVYKCVPTQWTHGGYYLCEKDIVTNSKGKIYTFYYPIKKVYPAKEYTKEVVTNYQNRSMGPYTNYDFSSIEPFEL